MLRGELDLPLTFSQLAASFRNLRPAGFRTCDRWRKLGTLRIRLVNLYYPDESPE